MLDYDYIQNLYRLIAVDLSRQKVLDANSKAIQQIEFIGQSKNPGNEILVNESMFVLTILEKIKEASIKYFSRKCNSFINNNKLSRSESQTNKYKIKQIKIWSKKKTGTILRINKKNSEDEEMPHELFLTTKQTTKTRNAFANNTYQQLQDLKKLKLL